MYLQLIQGHFQGHLRPHGLCHQKHGFQPGQPGQICLQRLHARVHDGVHDHGDLHFESTVPILLVLSDQESDLDIEKFKGAEFGYK